MTVSADVYTHKDIAYVYSDIEYDVILTLVLTYKCRLGEGERCTREKEMRSTTKEFEQKRQRGCSYIDKI